MGIFWFIIAATLFSIVVIMYFNADGFEYAREERIIMLDQEFQP